MSDLKRKLAAIMFTDMVDFTALMQTDETAALKIRARHKEVVQTIHQKYAGEIVQYFGDGTLSIFSNSIDAVNCAIEIQRHLKEPIAVPLRIGIHSGNIVIEEDGIVGDAVNIASRIESFANVGGVLISDVVQDQVKNQDNFDFVRLGKFRLKNVERPFEIFALSTEGVIVPNPDHLSGKGERTIIKNNLPVPANPILGREKELIELADLIEKNKLVTITGAGGLGKTRISIESGIRLESNFPGGVVFVSMATLPGDATLLPIIAEHLEVKEAAGRDLMNGIASIISDRKVLLILDNLEHISNAGQEVAELVSICPNIHVLSTSRSALKIKAEQEYALHTLPIPKDHQLKSLLNYASIELFVGRARKVNHDFELSEENAADIVSICNRLDGLPLALELAAARIRILPPDKLLKRLSRSLDLLTAGSSDLPDRHQTLRKTIDWSHSLLNEAEQGLFRKLAVFSGGFTIEAIEEVCYTDEDDAFFALDQLESLLRNGLVEKQEAGKRFSFLQTVKDFALEQLNASDEKEEYMMCHAIYFSKIAGLISRGTFGERQLERLKMGEAEDANIKSALDYLLTKAREGDETSKEMGLEFCGDLWMYWHIKGWNISTRDYCIDFFNSTDDHTPSIGKSKALLGLSIAYWMLGDYEKCLETAREHERIAHEIGHELELGKSKLNLTAGNLFLDIEKAGKHSIEAVSIFKKTGNNYWLGLSLWFQGNISLMRGDLPSARTKFRDTFALTSHFEDYELKGGSLAGLALIEFMEGNLHESIRKYEAALEAYQLVGDVAEVARILSEMSWAYLASGDIVKARAYTLDSIEAYQKVGSPRGVGLSMIGLAAIEAEEGQPEIAMQIAYAAEEFAKLEGIANIYNESSPGKTYLEKAKAALSETEISKACERGAQLSLEEILEITKSKAIQFI